MRSSGLLFALLLVLSTAARADGLSADVQRQVRAATFEVVQLKPDEGAVVYEKPLPLDLIPYQQRIDKYRSIGTAFAIDGHRFVTASHVLAIGQGSQYGPPALRDASGHVFDIDQIVKYSQEQDFAVLTLKQAPQAPALGSGPKPALNDPVYAVGNALGEGVVIRDGVFTSETPEEDEGRWQWLRFTAAASPGNSGGPLVDAQGRVVGIVLRKSQNENLNYAAPFDLVAAASEQQGSVGKRGVIRLPMMDASEKIDGRHSVHLPQALAGFYAENARIVSENVESANRTLLEHNAARLFPAGAGSEELLHQVMRSPLPRQIHETADRRWAIATPQTRTVQLSGNGMVVTGGGTLRVRAPDNLALKDLYADSKLYMDLLLQGALPLRRPVGTDSVKVTSLGKAAEHGSYTDSWGRTWQLLAWPIPFDDSYLITFSLPTPEGYATLVLPGTGGTRQVIVSEAELALNYMYVTLEGSVERWHEYLGLPGVQPKALAALNLAVDPGKRIGLRSKRFELGVAPELQALGKDAELALDLSYFRDGGAVVWDLASFEVSNRAVNGDFIGLRRMSVPGPDMTEGFQNTWKKLVSGDFIGLRRIPVPGPDMTEAFQNTWKKLVSGDFPYNGKPVSNNGASRESAVSTAAGVADADIKVRYELVVSAAGSSPDQALDDKLGHLKAAFKALEH